MSDSKFVAHCASCGHAYKVPSDSKVYPCKECGGEVTADVEAPDSSAEHMPKHRSIRERHPHEATTKVPAITGGVLLVLIVLGALGYVRGWFGFLTGAEPDFDKVTASFVEDWNAGDLEALAKSYHPSKAEDFRKTLGLIRKHRGWTAGFPVVRKETHELTKGTVDAPELADIVFSFDGIGTGGEELEGWGIASWQFEPSRDRWYMYKLRLCPSPLGDRPLEFAEAWGLSSIGELERFLSPATKDDLVGMVGKYAKQHGWLGEHPKVVQTLVSGEDAARQPPAGISGGQLVSATPVLSTHKTTKNPLVAKWAFNSGLDQWVIVGFKAFP